MMVSIEKAAMLTDRSQRWDNEISKDLAARISREYDEARAKAERKKP